MIFIFLFERFGWVVVKLIMYSNLFVTYICICD